MSTEPESYKARVIELASFIEYSDNSVLSKTLVEKKAGTITLFSFDAGQGLSEHTAPYDAVVHIIDGEAEIIIGGTASRVTTGQMIIMPAEIPHELRAIKQFKMLLTMIRA
jgi:quercetin dioxygenase-like cupin family protein